MAHNNERSLRTLPAFVAAGLLLSTSAPALAQSLPQTAPAQDAAPAAQPTVTPAPPPTATAPQTPAPAVAATPADTAPSATAQPDAAPPASSTPAATNPTVTTNPVVQPIPDSSQPAATTSAPAEATPQAATQRSPARSTPAPRAVGGISPSHAIERPAPAKTAATPRAAPAPTSDNSSGLSRRDPAGLYTADGTQVAASKTTVATHQSPYARYWPLEAAGAIVLIGLVGYAFTRRREEDEEQVYTTPVTEGPVAATPAFAETPAMPVAATATPVMAQPLAQSVTLDRENAPSASVLPAGPVPSGAAREALLERMVEAAPDAANPFHTVKARLRRARMILASRKQALHEQATETFDWRTYKPSLTQPTPGGNTLADATKREPVK